MDPYAHTQVKTHTRSNSPSLLNVSATNVWGTSSIKLSVVCSLKTFVLFCHVHYANQVSMSAFLWYRNVKESTSMHGNVCLLWGYQEFSKSVCKTVWRCVHVCSCVQHSEKGLVWSLLTDLSRFWSLSLVITGCWTNQRKINVPAPHKPRPSQLGRANPRLQYWSLSAHLQACHTFWICVHTQVLRQSAINYLHHSLHSSLKLRIILKADLNPRC